HAEDIRLEDGAHLVKRRDARAARLHNLRERPAWLARLRDAGVVDEHVETPEFFPDALGCGGDGGLIRNVELDGAGVRSVLDVARTHKHGEALRREIFRDLKTDSFVGPCDEGDAFLLHSKSPPLTGSKAPRDWWISCSPIRWRSNSALMTLEF